MFSRRYHVTEISGDRRSLMLVTKDPAKALNLAIDCRGRCGPFYRIEICDDAGHLLLDRALRELIQLNGTEG